MAKIQIIDTIKGHNFLAIQSIIDILQKYKPDWARTKIEILSKEKSTIIVLLDKNINDAKKPIGIDLKSKLQLDPEEIKTFISGVNIELLDKIKASSFFIIEKANNIFQKHKLDLKEYKIEVIGEGSSIIVIFSDKERIVGSRGSTGKLGFEVELNSNDLQVIRSNFIR